MMKLKGGMGIAGVRILLTIRPDRSFSFSGGNGERLLGMGIVFYRRQN